VSHICTSRGNCRLCIRYPGCVTGRKGLGRPRCRGSARKFARLPPNFASFVHPSPRLSSRPRQNRTYARARGPSRSVTTRHTLWRWRSSPLPRLPFPSRNERFFLLPESPWIDSIKLSWGAERLLVFSRRDLVLPLFPPEGTSATPPDLHSDRRNCWR